MPIGSDWSEVHVRSTEQVSIASADKMLRKYD